MIIKTNTFWQAFLFDFLEKDVLKIINDVAAGKTEK